MYVHDVNVHTINVHEIKSNKHESMFTFSSLSSHVDSISNYWFMGEQVPQALLRLLISIEIRRKQIHTDLCYVWGL